MIKVLSVLDVTKKSYLSDFIGSDVFSIVNRHFLP